MLAYASANSFAGSARSRSSCPGSGPTSSVAKATDAASADSRLRTVRSKRPGSQSQQRQQPQPAQADGCQVAALTGLATMDELVAHVGGLEDRLGEEPTRTRRGQQVCDALASSRFAVDSHILRVASERRLPEENLFLVQALAL